MSHRDHDQCIDVCNSLLRGEISAIETYSQALDKFHGDPEAEVLERFRQDHVASANRLRENVRDMGGVPSNDAGVWGGWARTIEGAAKLLGDSAALKVLKEGEEHGRKEYEEALENEHVLPGCKDMIRVELLPRQLSHIARLSNLVRIQ